MNTVIYYENAKKNNGNLLDGLKEALEVGMGGRMVQLEIHSSSSIEA